MKVEDFIWHFMINNADLHWDYPQKTQPIIAYEDTSQLLAIQSRIHRAYQWIVLGEIASWSTLLCLVKIGRLRRRGFYKLAPLATALPIMPLGFSLVAKRNFMISMGEKYEGRGLENRYLWKYNMRVHNDFDFIKSML